MTLEELRKIECSQYVHYNNTTAYLYVSTTEGRYYLFSNILSLAGSDPYPEVRRALGYSYSYWLASKEDYDHCGRHEDIVIVKKGRRPL